MSEIELVTEVLMSISALVLIAWSLWQYRQLMSESRAGQADKEKIVVEVHHDKSGGAAEHTLTLLLPPQEGRSLRVTGHAGEPVEDRGRRGIRITL